MLYVSLDSRGLGASPGIVQPASVNGQLLNISIFQLINVPPVDLPGFGLYPPEVLRLLASAIARRPPAAILLMYCGVPLRAIAPSASESGSRMGSFYNFSEAY